MSQSPTHNTPGLTYADAGVDIDAGNDMVENLSLIHI